MNKQVKTEHELLKEIIDEIGYESYNDDTQIQYNKEYKQFETPRPTLKFRKIDVREIIFTQSFMDKINFHLSIIQKKGIENTSRDLSLIVFLGLENPTQYLHQLIFPKK